MTVIFCLWLQDGSIYSYIVFGSVVLSSNYDAFEANGTVTVCAVITAQAIGEITITVHLSSQDSTATSKNDIISLRACFLIC